MANDIRADIDELIRYRDFLKRNMEHNVYLFEDFLRSVNGIEWDDVILERVTEVLNDIVKHINEIRAAIGYANQALSKMIDILDDYSSIRAD